MGILLSDIMLLSLLFGTAVSLAASASIGSQHQYCIVGAGPSGLQLAALLHDRGRDYVVFERSATAGSFFDSYPRHRTLATQPRPEARRGLEDAPLSLLGDRQPQMDTQGSPLTAEHYGKYLREFAEGLNVEYDSEVQMLQSAAGASGRFMLVHKTTGAKHGCQVVVVATGVSKPHDNPVSTGGQLLEHYHSVQPADTSFRNKSVCIIGTGQSAVETAQDLVLEASSVKLLGRRPVDWSRHSSTDPQLLDHLHQSGKLTFQQLPPLPGLVQLSSGRKALLSQDQITRFGAQLQTPDKCEELSESGQKFVADHPYIGAQYMRTRKGAPDRELAQLRTQLDTSACDRVIACTGFLADFSVFELSTAPVCHASPGLAAGEGKYPVLSSVYQVAGQPHLFMAGALTHGREAQDDPASTGSSVAAFRWRTRALFRHLEMLYYREPWPSTTVPRLTPLLLADLIVSRVREAALFQTGRPLAATPFAANQTATGGHALVDVFLIRSDIAVHYPEVPEAYAHAVSNGRPFIGLVFGYDALNTRFTGRRQARPALHYYQDARTAPLVHLMEADVTREYNSAATHIAPVVSWVRKILKAQRK